MNTNRELKLQALLDGELPPREAEEICQLVENDPEASRLLAELRAVKSALRGNDISRPLPENRDFYWSKIARQIEREERVRVVRPISWVWRVRRMLAALGGAAALVAVLLVAIHQSAPQTFDHVSVLAAGYEARTFRDRSSGLTYVFLHDTKPPTDGQSAPARVRNDGSSFNVEIE